MALRMLCDHPLFPAQAGVILIKDGITDVQTALPRAGGGDPLVRRPLTCPSISSPRRRG